MTSRERSEKREEKRHHKNGSQNFEERSAKGAQRNEQQILRRDGREMSSRFSGGMEENREKREESKWLPARFTAFLHGPRRVGWCRKGSGPRRDEGRAQREAGRPL